MNAADLANVARRMERFTIPEAITGCWLCWAAPSTGMGYARFSLNNRTVTGHRVAWEMAHGPIPAGMSVLHRCDTPACVNPDHLFLGTYKDNFNDMRAKGRAVFVRGLKNGKCRLSPEQVKAIRADGRSSYKIAAEYGIDPSYAWRIKSGERRPRLADEYSY